MYIHTSAHQPQQPQYVPVEAQPAYTIANNHPSISTITPSTGAYGYTEAIARGHIHADARPPQSVASEGNASFSIREDGTLYVCMKVCACVKGFKYKYILCCMNLLNKCGLQVQQSL